MPELHFTAIKPKNLAVVPVEGLQLKVDRELRSFIGDFIGQMSKYPPQQAWKNGEPKSGPRRGGRRTGTYGPGWVIGAVTPNSIEALNRVPYAVYVGGPKTGAKGKRQAGFMGDRGWPNLTEVGNRLWAKHTPAFRRIFTVSP